MHKCSHELKPCHTSYISKTNQLWIIQTELPSGYPVHQPRGGGCGKNDNNENNNNENNNNDNNDNNENNENNNNDNNENNENNNNDDNKTTLLTRVGKIQQK